MSSRVVGNDPRDHLALALDTHDLDEAVRTARLLSEYFRVLKVGLELYSAGGLSVMDTLKDMGYEVFCDLKLHDIPTTVNRTAKVIAKLGVSYLTVHAAGGSDMLRAAVEGLATGTPESVGGSKPDRVRLLAVTVLTSKPEVSQDLLAERMQVAVDAGCDGIVCAASDLVIADKHAGDLVRVVPGIRLPGDSADDQGRVATPGEAVSLGADLLVIGRSVTRASDPVGVAECFHEHLQSVL